MIKIDDEIAKKLDIDYSILYLTFIQTSILPSIDDLLDWRIKLEEMKSENKYPGDWYDREIRATDYLLSKNINSHC